MLVLIPLTLHYLPTIYDRFGRLNHYRSDANGVALAYPARWQESDQSFESDAAGGEKSTHLVVAPPTKGNPLGGVEIWTYASEAAYLAERNSGRQTPYASVSEFIKSHGTVGTLTIGGVQYPAITEEGEAYSSVCSVIPGPPHLYVACDIGAKTVQGLTAPQRMVLDRAALM